VPNVYRVTAVGSNAADWERHWTTLEAIVELEPARAWRHETVTLLASRGLSSVSHVTILDLGCGRGEIVADLKRRNPSARCIGLDGATNPSWRHRGGIEFLKLDLETLTIDDPQITRLRQNVDLLICSEVIEHMDDDRRLVRHMHALLKNGGRLVLTAPAGPVAHIDRYFGHRRHYSRKGVASLLTECGFVVTSSSASGFPFFNAYRLGLLLGGSTLSNRVVAPERLRPVLATRFVFWLFRGLFRIPTPRRLGWQLFVVAVKS
jgi:2-polyprenyl-3-methyl-5-hydroxy-6-metoxy-1,4-benzoquinol methylase